MRLPKAVTALAALLLALLILSFSIAVPILFRPFYYIQIDMLDLPERTGWSEETIREAYDEVLDFCVFGKPFGTGQLAWSQSGYSHFADVRGLFLLDLQVLVESVLLLIILLLVGRLAKRRSAKLLGRGPAFWAGAGLGAVFLVIGGLAALDFNRAFTVFHTIFFPGKDNWIFDPATDQIITILPQAFFRNCAILILAVLVAGCAALILWDLFHKGRKKVESPA